MTKRTAKKWVRVMVGRMPLGMERTVDNDQWYLVAAWFREMADALEGK